MNKIIPEDKGEKSPSKEQLLEELRLRYQDYQDMHPDLGYSAVSHYELGSFAMLVHAILTSES